MTIRPSSLPRKGAQIIAPGRLALYGILTLFAAIFITMIPILAMLRAEYHS